VELLESINELRSISAAARELNMSYRRAWLLVQSMNEAAGERLVEAATGGRSGGGARLTSLGRWAAATFRRLQSRLQDRATPFAPPAAAEVLHVAAAVSLEEVLGQLQADYAEAAGAAPVRCVFGASDELADQLLAGSPADLFLSADPRQLDRLDAAGLTVPGGRVVLAANTLAAIEPAGRRSRINAPADLLRPETGRIAVARPACPLGGYTRAYLEQRGLYEALAPRLVVADGAQSVASAVRAERAEVGLVYGSDSGRADGCRLLFRVRRPPAPIRYAAAPIRRGGAPEQARAFLAFLSSGAAAQRFRRCGFLVPSAASSAR
jgi:molybdate transport system substrate-binding protein